MVEVRPVVSSVQILERVLHLITVSAIKDLSEENVKWLLVLEYIVIIQKSVEEMETV
jgi:hypothetical protein